MIGVLYLMLILSNRPSLYIFDPLNGFELFHQTVEGGDVIDRDGDMSLKRPSFESIEMPLIYMFFSFEIIDVMFVTIPISSFPITRRTVTYLEPIFPDQRALTTL